MPSLSLPVNPTLYHIQFWSSSRPAALLMELGLATLDGSSGGSDHKKIDIVTISESELKSDPMLCKLNPQKRLPFFVDPTNDILKLNESGGMVQYLLETYDTSNQLWPTVSDPTRAEYLKLIHFGPATAYHVAVPILFHFMEDAPVQTSVKEYETKKKEWHSIVAPTYEQALEKFGGPYLLGSKFSAADIVCGYDLMTISFTKCADELLAPHPKVKAYLDVISQRDVYKTLYTMPSGN